MSPANDEETDITVTLPAFLEAAPDVWKAVRECTLEDVLAALRRETDPQRREGIEKILRLNGSVWNDFPLMTVGEMMKR